MSISSFVRIVTVTAVIGCFMPMSARAEDKGVQATLDATPEATHKAAADALAVIGCEIKKDDPTHLEGVRKHKIGAFVGSGGETVSVSITTQAEGKTNVDIRTKRTFVGGAGQKNWDQPVLDEIRKSLASTAAPSPSK
jgi:hypothetical protein